jgi:RHS repeat-associated protein
MELSIMRRRVGAFLFTVIAGHSDAAGAAIGRTPGAAAVSPDGEAAYSVPLDLPPGTNGLTPALSLQYGHRSHAGLLGIGWIIGGLSQIARCPRTVVQDGVSAPVTQTAADRFCLDGQRLVVTNGVAYGGAGAEYRTEIESFARIRSYTGPGSGPQYFVLEAPDGRVLEYGATADSRIDTGGGDASPTRPARVWALNRIRDRSGNVIDFEYYEDITNGSFRITHLRYNSNPGAGVTPSHQIDFFYENRPSNEVDVAYVAGMPIRDVVRLDRIDVLYNGAVLRRYELIYEPALSAAGHSRLASIRECGAGGSDCLAATVFTWQNGVAGFGAESGLTAAIPGPTPLPDNKLWSMVDINGDGRGDYVWSGGTSLGSATLRYRLGLASGAFGAEMNTGIACPYGIGSPFDHNGDGRDDLLMISAAWQWVVVPGSAAGFGAPIATGLAPPSHMVDYRGADLNGDGLGDLAWSEIPDFYGNSLVVRMRPAQPGGGFAATPSLLYEQFAVVGYESPQGGEFLGRPGQRIDLDGNGSDDLLMNENYSVARISATKYATDHFDGSFWGAIPADINGDGCTDFAYKHYAATLRVRIGGCGIGWAGPELLGPAWTGAAQLHVHDWNGDGRDDLLLSGATTWSIVQSYGESLAPIVDTGIPHNNALSALAFDANGDGLKDLVTRAGGQLRRRLRNGPKPDFLLTAVDGFGVTASFDYRPLTDAAVYVRGNGAIHPEQDMQSAAYVVSALHTTDGTGLAAMRTTRYSYGGLRRHLLGRGSLGFAKRASVDTTLGYDTRVEETRRQDFPYTGLPISIITRQGNGTLLSTTSLTWSTLNLGSGAARRHFPYRSALTKKRHEVGGSYDGVEIASITHTVAAIDASSGLVTDETATITETTSGIGAGSSSSLRTLHSAFLNDTTNWCLGRPQVTQLTASHTLTGGTAITQSLSQTWDGLKCRPTQQRLEPGSSQWQVTFGLAYDGFGNLASRAVTGAGMSTRTTTFNWGSRGQLPVSVRNPLSQTTALSWDYGPGLPTAMTDPNLLTSRWTYDAFGRLVQETRPDQTSAAWTRTPCPSGCNPRAQYRLTQFENDNAGVTRATTVINIDRLGRAFRSATSRPGGGTSVILVDTDSRGRIIHQHLPYWSGSAPAGYWQYDYDALDRVVSASLRTAGGAIDRATGFRYDGLEVTQTDPLGRATTETRSAWGALVRVTDPLGGSTQYENDAFGRLLRVRDALNNVQGTISYNVRGMKTAHANMDMGSWTWTRNALGEVVSLRDAKSQVLNFAYDKLGRLTSRTSSESTSSFTWGNSVTQRNIGQLASLAGPGYAETFTYDANGRPATRTITADATYRYDYAYNALGLLASLTYPATGSGGRFRLGYEYDSGQLVRIKDANAPAISFWQLNAQDASGNPIDQTLGAAIRVITGFNPTTGTIDYRQTGPGGGSAIQDLAYAWDSNDNLVRRQDLKQGLTEEFRYDPLDRLDDSRRNGTTNLDLGYDLIGNIRWKSDVCPTTAPCYAYHATRKHAVTAAGGQSYAYDANGNMTSRGGASIGWTSDNMPSAIAHANGNSSQFWHGPIGNRWKQIASQAGTTETTIYAGELMEKVTRAGVTAWRHYVVAPAGTAALHLRYNNGSPATTRYLTHDHQGSTDKILDASGNILVTESFTAFGRRRGANWSGAPGAPELSAIAANTRDGYTGHEHLDNLDLIHMNGRVYDPHIGRFISADPYVPAPFSGQSLNRYAYVWNNPLSFVDPSGFTPCVQGSSGRCAQVTVYGLSWADYFRYVGGAGASQAESASQRDPCGQDSAALACVMQQGRLVSPASVVLTAGTQTDSALARSPTVDRLQGAAARAANLAFNSSPVAWLFGTNADFEWFPVPDSEAGQAGATMGSIGYFFGGAAGILRKGTAEMLGITPSHVARSFQGTQKYPGIDRFRDITLKKGTVIYSGYPGQSAFYTTASALRRGGGSSTSLFRGLQVGAHRHLGHRSRVAAYEVLADTPAAFGLAIANSQYGAGWLPQVVVPSFRSDLRYLADFPLGP